MVTPLSKEFGSYRVYWRLHCPEMNSSVRYAPMNRSHILGFPNQMPCIDWQTYFPKFKDKEGDDVSFHLVKFHMHSCNLEV